MWLPVIFLINPRSEIEEEFKIVLRLILEDSVTLLKFLPNKLLVKALTITEIYT